MDIFKLIYEHDLRLDRLRERQTDRKTPETGSSIEAFLKPDPTYSKFYITGTRIDKPEFGLDVLSRYTDLVDKLQAGLEPCRYFSPSGEVDSFHELVNALDVWQAGLLTRQGEPESDLEQLAIDHESNVGHKKDALRQALKRNELVLYKEQAKNGFDLHLFTETNIYRNLFYPLQKLVNDSFRFFSINGKRIRSEQKFYFETWALDRPPHGIEEVFKETVL